VHTTSYHPDTSIPSVVLYLALRGRFGHKRCPRNVGEARSHARRNPDLGAAAEAEIHKLYAMSPDFLVELEDRYTRLSKDMKQTVAWQEVSEIFMTGDARRVLRMF